MIFFLKTESIYRSFRRLDFFHMEFFFSSIMSHFSICFGDSFKNIDLFIISLSGLSFSVNHINDYKEMKKINKINQRAYCFFQQFTNCLQFQALLTYITLVFIKIHALLTQCVYEQNSTFIWFINEQHISFSGLTSNQHFQIRSYLFSYTTYISTFLISVVPFGMYIVTNCILNCF